MAVEAELLCLLIQLMMLPVVEDLQHILMDIIHQLNPVDLVVEHPHTRHRGMVVELEGYRGIASPVRLSRTPASYRAAPPVLGGDTREVLAELGLSAEAIDALVRRGIVRA